MKTWNDYKDHVKTIDSEGKVDIEEAENLAAIVGAMIDTAECTWNQPERTCRHLWNSSVFCSKNRILQNHPEFRYLTKDFSAAWSEAHRICIKTD